MARMIPPVIDPYTKSEGEREVFRRLKEDPATHDWIVLHSLDVAHHLTQIEGEIDFVVIIPRKGLLCVEVKAHRHIRCLDGHWLFGRNEDPGVSPFKQVSRAMHSVRHDVTTRDPSLKDVLFWSCVVFPYVEFTQESEEWHTWQLIDGRVFRARPLGALLLHVLERARKYLASNPAAKWFRPDTSEPTPGQCSAIAQILRPIFEVYESPKARRQQEEALMLRYTEEQFAALDAMEDNPRVIFTGPAGTGKTLLAIEGAKRASDENQRAQLICFNDLLGHWLKEQVAPLQNVVAGTLHSHMLHVAGIQVEHPSSDFWQEELPELATERLIEDAKPEHLFDVLIIDEAQDVMRESYLDFLDLSLKGGLAGGTLRVFGDFEKQAIYDASTLSLPEFKQQRCTDAAIYSLRTNCRNSPRVAALVRILCDLQPDYKQIRRPDNDVEPRTAYYRHQADQQRFLIATLESLHDEKFAWEDIVILSPKRDDQSVAASLGPPWRQRLRPCRDRQKGSIRYCTIQAFKGLEAPAVVVSDIDHADDDRSRALLYVALSRAIHRLIVLIDERAKPQVLRLMLGPAQGSDLKTGT